MATSVSPIDIVTFVVAFILPLVNAFLTKPPWSPALKGLWLAGLSVATAVANEIVTDLASHLSFNPGRALFAFGAVFVVAVASHHGILNQPRANKKSIIETVEARRS